MSLSGREIKTEAFAAVGGGWPVDRIMVRPSLDLCSSYRNALMDYLAGEGAPLAYLTGSLR